MSELQKPKDVEKEIKAPETEKKRAKTTKALLKEIQDRQSTDTNNEEKK